MKKDYYTSWTHGEKKIKLARALSMIEDSTVEEVSRFTGVPKTIITKAAHEMGISQRLKDEGKIPLLSTEFYESITPIIPTESKEERVMRIYESIQHLEQTCNHEKHFTRCSHCMKILGSEIHFIKIDDLLNIVKQVELDLSDNDPSCDDERAEMALLISDRVYKKLTYSDELC